MLSVLVVLDWPARIVLEVKLVKVDIRTKVEVPKPTDVGLTEDAKLSVTV